MSITGDTRKLNQAYNDCMGWIRHEASKLDAKESNLLLVNLIDKLAEILRRSLEHE